MPSIVIEINRNPSRQELRQFAAFWFPAFWALVGFLLYGGLKRVENWMLARRRGL